MTHEQRVKRARGRLVLQAPFFGSLALRLRIEIDPGTKTASADGRTLRFNPDYIAEMTDERLKALVAHETLHCANGHMWRRGPRDHEKWNEACDYAINKILVDAGFDVDRERWLLDSAFDGLSAEEIFQRLPDKPKGGGGQGGKGSGGGADVGEILDPPTGVDDKGTPAPTEAEWKVATVQASKAQKAGSRPGSLQRMLDELVQPRVDWRSVLQRFVQQTAKGDYSWALPNARYISQGLFLPALQSPACPPIVFIRDTSASLDVPALRACTSELLAAVRDAAPESFIVIDADTDVRVTHRFEDSASVDAADIPDPVGGGGTQFDEALKAADSEGACAIIYFTDGDNHDRGHVDETETPVLWALTEPADVPFGEVIELEGGA